MKPDTFIPYIQVRSKGVLLYEMPESPYSHQRHKLSLPTYSGTVTDHARRRIIRTVDVFLQKSPVRVIYNPVLACKVNFRLSFITLTISNPQRVDVKQGHSALKVWLQHFRRTPSKKAISEQLSSYVWKCELQERGQLHYHVTCSSFLHWAEIQRVWNGIQMTRGWIHDFSAKYGHTNPNSTDVHSVYKVRDVQAYLSKYLAKQQFIDISHDGFPTMQVQRSIGGKVWDCSNDLKVKRFADELDSDTSQRIGDAISKGEVKKMTFPRCTLLCHERPTDLLSPSLYNNYRKWI